MDLSYRWRRLRVPLLSLAVIAVVVVVAGCGSSGSSSESTSSGAEASNTESGGADTTASASGGSEGVKEAAALTKKYMQAPTKIGQTTPLPEAPPTDEEFICLVQGTVPAVVEVCKATEEAASALGWKSSSINYDPANPSSLQGAFNSALAKKPSAVGMVGLAPETYGNAVIEAYGKAGIPIIVGAAGPVPPNNETLLGPSNSPASTEFAGERIADWFVSDSEGKGQAVIVNIPSFPTLKAGQAGIQSETERLCPECSTDELDVTLQQVGAGTVPNAVISYLQSHPEVDYVLFTDGDWAAGISQALNGAGLSEIKVGGITPTSEQLAGLQSGEQAAWTGYSFKYNGYGMIDIAARHAVGAPINKDDEIAPTQILTPENVGEITEWNEPENSLEQFEELWQVK